MNTIHTNFFTGENKYRNGNQIMRNVLHKDYKYFLYVNKLPSAYNKADLEKATREYKGPKELEALAASQEMDLYTNFYLSKVKINGGFDDKMTPEMVEQDYRDFQTTYSI